MNQLGLASDAQLKTFMFLYLGQACMSARFQSFMLPSAYDGSATPGRVFTVVHSTGSLPSTDIISWMRALRLTACPPATATLAVSLVPSAMNQQPRNPEAFMFLATVYPFCWP